MKNKILFVTIKRIGTKLSLREGSEAPMKSGTKQSPTGLLRDSVPRNDRFYYHLYHIAEQLLLFFIIFFFLFINTSAFAASSATYAITSDVFSNGGAIDASSATYRINDIIAQDLLIGMNSSVHYMLSAGRYVYINTTPPPAPVITVPTDDPHTQEVLGVTMSGTCDSSTYAIHVGGSASGVTYTAGATTWVYSGTLAGKDITYSVTALDSLGNESTADTEEFLLTITADHDSDSLPHYYEDEYGLDDNDPNYPNGKNDDSDHDGQTNYEEYLADTDPLDGTSILKISDIAVSSGTGITIQFPTSSKRNYRIYYSNDAYSDLMTWTLATTWSTYLWTDDGTYTGVSPLDSSIAHRYYKITPVFGSGWQSAGVTGLDNTMATWYLSEGYTGGNFDEWVLIQNPNDSAAEITVTFMKEDGSTVERYITVAPTSRHTIHVDEIVPDSSISTKVKSTNGVGIIVERAMYWDAGGVRWAGGHSSSGVKSPETTWYLAEGCTSGFDEWVLIQNPTNSTANVTLTFMKSDGTMVPLNTTVGPTSRKTIRVNDYVPNASVSAKVESTNGVGIIVERAMYWDAGGLHWAEGHSGSGVTSPAVIWYLAEGCTSGFDEWVLIQNPNNSTANVTLTFMKSDGATIPLNTTVGPTSRKTIRVNDYVPNASVSAKVESTNGIGIIVERAMYWDAGGVRWAGGHCSSGVTSAKTAWYLAEGCTGGNFDEWVLIQNPNNTVANITVTFMEENGLTVERYITVGPTSRYTIHVNDIVPESSLSTRVISTNGVGIIVERAMYWDSDVTDLNATGAFAVQRDKKIHWKGGHCAAGISK